MGTSQKQYVLSRLRLDDVLLYDSTDVLEDMQGWQTSKHHYLAEALQDKADPIVVEVGVWKGASTVFMAQALRDAGSGGVVVAVDTYLGSHIQVGDPKWHPSLRYERGWPHLFYTFLDNVKAAGVQDYVAPLPLDSINAAELLANVGITPDVVHVDGGHDYLSVKHDLTVWFQILKGGGQLICDDYTPAYPGVIQAVDEFRAGHNVDLFESSLGKCRMIKSNNTELGAESTHQQSALIAEERNYLLGRCAELERERNDASSRLELIQESRSWRAINRVKRLIHGSS